MSEIKLLDHGYIKLIETWGSDQQIVESARMSTDRGFKGWDKDYKFLKFLWENKHHTPFEMAGAIVEVKAPIFVFREWMRHRASSFNEMSARYIPLPDENYVPSVERITEAIELAKISKNKQEQSVSDGFESPEVTQAHMQDLYHHIERLYQHMLEQGLPKELARIVLPVGRYSKMRSGANLRNWLHFLSLRQADNAQWEIRQYANALYQILGERFPKTMEIVNEGKG